MKKELTFALACASTFALFAVDITIPPKADFELYAEGDTVAGQADLGPNGALHWIYTGASGSEDSSKVQTYGGEISVPTAPGDYGSKYLSLSTEGGTLWRSLSSENANAEGTLGDAQAIPPTGLYIDTMVQFTPTEDGGDPDPDPSDKLAIWLKVETGEGLETPVTNLCVKAGHVYRDGSEAVDPMTFVLEGTSGVVPGTWYRLTVKAIPDVTKSIAYGGRSTGVTGYQILLDGQALSTKATVFESSYIDWAYDEWLEDADKALLQSGTVFAGLDGFVTTATLQAVGFKGSGALDNLAITDEDPHESGGDPTFEVDWGKDTVTAVWGETPPTADELAAIQAWATANGLSAAQIAGETGAAAYLLGMTTVPSEVPALSITAIDQTTEGWTVTVACSAQPDLSKVNGKLTVKTATSLGEAWTVQTYDASNLAPADGNRKVVIKITGADARFIKAALTK